MTSNMSAFHFHYLFQFYSVGITRDEAYQENDDIFMLFLEHHKRIYKTAGRYCTGNILIHTILRTASKDETDLAAGVF